MNKWMEVLIASRKRENEMYLCSGFDLLTLKFTSSFHDEDSFTIAIQPSCRFTIFCPHIED
jgi:hypothetical protein